MFVVWIVWVVWVVWVVSLSTAALTGWNVKGGFLLVVIFNDKKQQLLFV